jgi:deoxycytidylate deaminase
MTDITHTSWPITNVVIKKNKGAEILYITRSTEGTPVTEKVDFTNCMLFDRAEENGVVKEIFIRHPYLSKNFTIEYANNEFLAIAKNVWEHDALERVHPTATVLVVNGNVIGKAGNGLTLHTLETCERKKLNMPTGQGYHLCNGNHLPENHSEPKAIRNAIANGNQSLLRDATAYLYGHWWSCIDCSNALEKAEIKHLVVSKDWTRRFLEI